MICHCGGALDRFLKKGKPVDDVKQAHGVDTIATASGEETGGSVGIAKKPANGKKKKLDVYEQPVLRYLLLRSALPLAR